MAYDLAGRLTRISWPDGLDIDYGHLVTGEVSAIVEEGTTSLATYGYDDRGRRTSLTRGNGTSTSYGYDNADRLTQLVQNLNGTGSDLTLDFSYNPAGQIVSNARDNNAYSFTGHANLNRADTINGLNQVTATGSTSVSHDARGNLGGVAADWPTYTSENFLNTTASALILPNPLLRPLQVYNTSTGGAVRFDYLGDQLAAEYDTSNAMLRRYVYGPGGEPLVWYEGSGTSTRRWMHADERGSVIAVSDGSGDLYGSANRYDEYGNPQGTLTGRFGYTGQAWLPEIGMYSYRARIYNPALGRFMQADPIGYDAGMNLYAYVRNDPVNLTDPSGLTYTSCTGSRLCVVPRPQNGGFGGSLPLGGLCGSCSGFSIMGPSGEATKTTTWTLIDKNTGLFYGYKINYSSPSASNNFMSLLQYWYTPGLASHGIGTIDLTEEAFSHIIAEHGSAVSNAGHFDPVFFSMGRPGFAALVAPYLNTAAVGPWPGYGGTAPKALEIYIRFPYVIGGSGSYRNRQDMPTHTMLMRVVGVGNHYTVVSAYPIRD